MTLVVSTTKTPVDKYVAKFMVARDHRVYVWYLNTMSDTFYSSALRNG